MHTLSVMVDSIFVGERHRALSEDAVTRLQGSLKEIGMKQPISIRIVDEMEIDGKLTAGVPVLVAGRHRLEAARRLKWTQIDCIELVEDALLAELWEIAENLHRCDLTKEQRDQHIRRYAELLEAMPRIVTQTAQQSAGRPKTVARRIADETGLSRDTVKRALNPRPAALPITEEDATERQLAALMNAWNRAGREARDQFLHEIHMKEAA